MQASAALVSRSHPRRLPSARMNHVGRASVPLLGRLLCEDESLLQEKPKKPLDRDSTLQDLEDCETCPSYDGLEPEHYLRFNRHPWQSRVGCRSISDFYCEGCNLTATVERDTMKISNIKCPRCDGEESDTFSMYFVGTKAVDSRYRRDDDDDD